MRPPRECRIINNFLSNRVQTLTNIFGPSPSWTAFRGLQYELIDLRSRENSSVQSLRHIDWMCWLHAVPISFRPKPDLFTPKTFIFSTKTVSAVSVASPTFSYVFFALKKTKIKWWNLTDTETQSVNQIVLYSIHYSYYHGIIVRQSFFAEQWKPQKQKFVFFPSVVQSKQTKWNFK